MEENDFNFKIFNLDRVWRMVQLVIRYGFWGFIAWLAKEVFISWGGKTTIADVKFSAVVDWLENSPSQLAWITVLAMLTCTVIATCWALGERFVRKRVTRRLQARNIDLEKLVDSGRTSSMLLPL